MADEPIYLAQQTDLDNHKNATGNVHGMVKGDIGLGNVDNTADANKSVKHATTAGSLATARTITLSGDVSGSVSFNGSKDVTITTTVADDSHNHTIANVDGLQTALDGKETSGAAATALTNAKSYTDTQLANLVNGAPTTLDTLGEIATAFEEHADIVEALDEAIGSKAPIDHTHSAATTSAAGFMSATDKAKLDGIAAGANKYSHPTYTSKSSGFYKVTVDGTGHVSGATAVTKDDITGLGIPAQDTTYSAATQSANGLMSSSDKKKLDGIATGAEVNQNAFSNITIGSTTIAADSKTDTLTLVAGSNITLTPDATNDKVTIAATNTVYTHPTTSGNKHIPAGGSSGQILRWSADGTAVWGADSNTTYSAATQSAAGLMSAADKKKLDGIAEGANNYTYTLPTAGSSLGGVKTTSTVTSTSGLTACPIISGVPYYKDTNTTYSAATTSDNGLMSASDKSKLDGIAAGANAYTHPSYTAKSSGFYKVTVDASGHVSAATAVTKADITGLGIPAQDTTYSAATTSAAGLMSAADKTKLNATNVAWGTCSTEAATAAKVITISGNTNWALTAGAIIAVKFSATNTASNPTFNVNGTGAKSVWYSAAVLTTSSLSYAGYKDRPCFYVYDGTQFVFLGWSYDANTTYTNVKLGHGYATCSTAAATAAKVGTLSSYTLVTGGIVAVKFTYAVPANATLNINSKGAKAIYHRGAKITAGVINAGDTATFMYNGSYYHLLSVDSEPTNIATLQSKVSALETKVADLEALLAYIVGVDDTGVYVEEGV